ncbi:SWIM zinc finger family protein [Pseudoduganella sp.]|uniref:SWIM zinc finger family protein n=1 Tax=Pseudoduganella sp. TaxID=1880898 RepID=UPI0035AEAB50
MILTAEQILALAPDAASAKAGSGQASLAKWSGLGGHAQALWGLCQGSGKEPYRAQIDLAGPAFKCNCPSRKFPCKHGLGLYLLYARERAAFCETEAPQWVSDWLHSREERSEKKAARQAEAATPEALAAREASQQKRQEKRQGNVEAGLAVLDTWLEDLARDGLATLRGKPSREWDAMAARLVDCQAPGLAGRLRRLGLQVYGGGGAGWELAAARELGQLALLRRAYQRLAALPAGLQHEVRAAIGWATSQEEVLALAGVCDTWTVCGNRLQDDGRVSSRATYLRGAGSGRWAMLLQFSAGSQALPAPLLHGASYHGTLHFYPAAWPLRALAAPDFAVAAGPVAMPAAPDGEGFAAPLLAYAQALAANPFLESCPMHLAAVTPVFAPGSAAPWSLRAANGEALALDGAFRQAWQLHALAGGHAVEVFGLWSGYSFLPLAVSAAGRAVSFDGGQA